MAASAPKRRRKRTAAKAGAKTGAKARKPASAKKGASARKPKKRPVSGKQLWLCNALYAKVPDSKREPMQPPTTSAEANAQIRTMAGAKMDADRKTAQAAVGRVLKGTRKSANAPISDAKSLKAAATKVRI